VERPDGHELDASEASDLGAEDPHRGPKAFVADHNISYPSLYDPAGDLLLKFPAGTLNPQTIPTTIILDRQGRVAARALLPLSSGQLTQMLAPVLAEKS
jgi:hypothetical protein